MFRYIEFMLNGHGWMISIDIGTPAQKPLLTVDTGAPDLHVWSTFLPAEKLAPGVVLYNLWVSSKEVPGESFKQCYHNGCFWGPVRQEYVKVGNLVVTNYNFEMVIDTSWAYKQCPPHQLCGSAGLAQS
jgi:hypothetical protein